MHAHRLTEVIQKGGYSIPYVFRIAEQICHAMIEKEDACIVHK
jgi:hypothetical protein